MNAGTSVVAIVLRCPECGVELAGLDADQAWACPSCGNAWEVEGDRLAPRPYRVWALGAEGVVAHLPFWRIECTADVVSDDPAARAAAEAAAAAGRVWVRAFGLRAAFAVGDPGEMLTFAAHAERIEGGPLPVCVGARIGSREAVRIAELLILARADREVDVSPVTLRLDVREIALVAIPYVDAGPDLACAADGRSFRKSAFPDCEAILAAARR